MEHPYDVLNLSMDVEAEFPNSNLHNFRGRVCIKRHDKDIGRVVPITMNQMLLRGCMLKNSQFVLGQVVYTGSETRIQMNSAAVPLKIGSFDHFLNMQVAILILAQVILCILCAILNFLWRENEVCLHSRATPVTYVYILRMWELSTI
jgi:magnesium-transporting ATPase (P-type)